MQEVLLCPTCNENFHQSYLSTHVELKHLPPRQEEMAQLNCGTCTYTVAATAKNAMIQHCLLTGHNPKRVNTIWNGYLGMADLRNREIIRIGMDIQNQNMTAPENDQYPVYIEESRRFRRSKQASVDSAKPAKTAPNDRRSSLESVPENDSTGVVDLSQEADQRPAKSYRVSSDEIQVIARHRKDPITFDPIRGMYTKPTEKEAEENVRMMQPSMGENHKVAKKHNKGRSQDQRNLREILQEGTNRNIFSDLDASFSDQESRPVNGRSETKRKTSHILKADDSPHQKQPKLEDCNRDGSIEESVEDFISASASQMDDVNLECTACGKGLSNAGKKANLVIKAVSHVLTHVRPVAVFECISCGQGFLRRTTLRVHIQKKHDVPRPLECKNYTIVGTEKEEDEIKAKLAECFPGLDLKKNLNVFRCIV